MKGESKTFLSIPRGFVEIQILRILEKPCHGYEIIKHFEKECSCWKPSPGSVYPVLKKLKKSGLVSEKTIGKRKVYSLTKSGRERLRKIDFYRKEIRRKLVSLFRMMGENADYIESGLEVFERIKRSPEKIKKFRKINERFMKELVKLAEE
ncbi:MAG: PadR family transcriptional regulator [Candidatus Aenigmatarchaeota archaeon]